MMVQEQDEGSTTYNSLLHVAFFFARLHSLDCSSRFCFYWQKKHKRLEKGLEADINM